MPVCHVGVIVQDKEELKAVYDTLVEAGFSESHSISAEHMESFRRRPHFAIGVDDVGDILAIFDFGEDDGDVVCRPADVVEVARAIFGGN